VPTHKKQESIRAICSGLRCFDCGFAKSRYDFKIKLTAIQWFNVVLICIVIKQGSNSTWPSTWKTEEGTKK